MFEEKGYKLIDFNLGYEDLITKSFKECIRANKYQPESIDVVVPDPIDVYMESLTSIIHRDYITSIIEKEIGLKLIPTYCYTRKYFQGSILIPHIDRGACEISLSYCISGPEWEFNIMGENATTLITKRGNAVIYRGCEIKHGRICPASGEIIQVFNHWIISGGTKSQDAYNNNEINEDFYKAIPPKFIPENQVSRGKKRGSILHPRESLTGLLHLR